MERSSLVQYLPRMQKALGLVPSATYTCALPYVKFFLRDGIVFNPGFGDLSSSRIEPGKREIFGLILPVTNFLNNTKVFEFLWPC